MSLSTRKIVISGILGAVAILLGVTRLGFIPVPNLSGNATIMHVPAILGGIMEGPVVGALVGLIFGIFSFLNATIPLFADPLVAVVPRIFIGITAYFAYTALKPVNSYLALVVGATVGTLTNTVLVLGSGILRGYLPASVFWPITLTNGLAEVVIASVITVALVAGLEKMRKGSVAG
ncbi:MAG: ECF transporter S component [Bacillota bacterium]